MPTLTALPSTAALAYYHPERTDRRARMVARLRPHSTAPIEDVLTNLLAEPLRVTDRDRAMVADEIDALAEVLQARTDRSIDLP